MPSTRRIWITILVVILVIWLFFYDGIEKIPFLNTLWNAINNWVKSVTGATLMDIVRRVLVFILWLLKLVLNFILNLLNSVTGLVQR